MKNKHNKKTEWKTHLGTTVTIEGMEDEHLANTIQFVSYYVNYYSKSLLDVFKKEAKNRGLTKEFLNRAPFPYKDGKGSYIIWDYEIGAPKIIGSYLRS